MTTSSAYVYFAKPIGMDGPVKIGCSNNSIKRLKSLATWSPFPLEIVAVVPGGFHLERNIHDCFACSHSHREWFHPSPRLTEAMNALSRGAPVEEAIDLSKREGRLRRKKCGGAQWSEITRQKMSVLARIRHALRKVGVDCQYDGPPHIRAIQGASETRLLTEAESADLFAFIADPAKFVHLCRDRTPTPSPQGEAA